MSVISKALGLGAAVLLLAGAAHAAEKTGTKAPKERLICKSIQETGSIALRLRQCFTKQEWERIAEAARARGQRLQSDMASGMVSN